MRRKEEGAGCAPFAEGWDNLSVCLSVCLSVLSVTSVHCGQAVGRIKTKLGMQVGLGHGHIVLDGDPAPPPPKGHSPPFSAHICCGQMTAWIKMSLGMELGLGQGDFVLDGIQPPSPKKGRSPPPIFGPFLLWPNGWMDQDATWYGCRPQPRGLCVRWRPTSPPQKRARSPPPKFSAHVYCGQTAGWMKLVLGIEVGLSPGDFVLDGDPAPTKGHRPPIFSPYLLRPNGCMDQDVTWYGARP